MTDGGNARGGMRGGISAALIEAVDGELVIFAAAKAVPTTDAHNIGATIVGVVAAAAGLAPRDVFVGVAAVC